jgi:outer membrane biosynthesis protein TonB
MPEHYSDSKPEKKKRGRPRKMKAPEPEPEPAPAPAPEPSKKLVSKVKLTDKQKEDLRKHMEKSGLSGSEAKSHRMKMMSRMRRGMSVAAAHKDITGK